MLAEIRRLREPCSRGARNDADELAADLLSLQRGLTGDRSLIGSSYMQEARRLSAYLAFYWPISYAQAYGMLTMASVQFKRGTGLRILDLGSGPAPCAFAAADYASVDAAAAVEITACDPSSLALESASRLAAAAGYAFQAHGSWRAGADPLPSGKFDVVAVGHVLNELKRGAADRLDFRFEFLKKALDALDGGGVLVVLEPALLSTGREMLTLRDRLAAIGYGVDAPCLRAGPCPALMQENHTCHSDFAARLPALALELAARTGLDKDLVKTTGFVFSRAPKHPTAATGSYRVVSEPLLNKAGRVRLLLCGEEGRLPLSAKPGEGYAAEKAFFSLKRSSRVTLRNPVRRENGWGVGPDTTIETD